MHGFLVGLGADVRGRVWSEVGGVYRMVLCRLREVLRVPSVVVGGVGLSGEYTGGKYGAVYSFCDAS